MFHGQRISEYGATLKIVKHVLKKNNLITERSTHLGDDLIKICRVVRGCDGSFRVRGPAVPEL
jgi:hypothetical protein